jgi:hypothetical protein
VTTLADSLIKYGMTQVGDPYVFGAEGPSAFDCSGLMLFVFEHFGLKLPRTAAQQQRFAKPVTGAPRPGDLVFWGAPAHHVALYVGGGKVLSAPHAGANVRVQDVWGSPTYGRVPGVLSNPTVAAGAGAVLPVALGIDTALGNLAASGRVLMFVAGGLALVGLGLWSITKGDS